MAALRALWGEDRASCAESRPPAEDPADWLTVQQAACELDVSASTVRRMIHDGRLRHRRHVRRRHHVYLVYLEGSFHGGRARPANVIDLAARRQARSTVAAGAGLPLQLPAIQARPERVEHLLRALARTATRRPKALPPDIGGPQSNPDDPYGRYRWLARRRRWWPFSS
jgi:excisionase family DNA binding protein